ncbi:uncharacterized protein A1O9_10369 [Exophiala aquamarina CBS 119918]|uniref:ABM domain-containing protein n=1 Tax=Exophiala aquamarina CBS 119918 TaxID=1182545 RepID=A0A072NZW0_9EURO|nr:uncharacterized protein A1O9_10369 [Exophiala aquamarina CBS 119918]KEF53394.1 hypothetical protein A1O9_10369 [Exophiala aquamarina CBS 119918]
MAIIELAHVQLKDGLTTSDPVLLKNLKAVKSVIEKHSKLPTQFFEQTDDPTMLFMVGAWPNKETSQHGFNGSPHQGEILDLVKDQMGIDWVHYMDIDQNAIPIHAPLLAIVKGEFPKHVNRAIADQDFKTIAQGLGETRYAAVSAWNLRKDKHEPDVKVHFSGWESLDKATEGLVGLIENPHDFTAEPTLVNIFVTKKVELD